jgi:hypothetical protein
MGYDVSYSLIYGIQLDIDQTARQALENASNDDLEIAEFGCHATAENRQHFAFSKKLYRRLTSSYDKPTFEAIQISKIPDQLHEPEYTREILASALDDIAAERDIYPINTIGEWDWYLVSSGG